MTVLNKHRELRKELSNPAIGSNHHLRKLALSLLDELEAAEKRIAELQIARDKCLPHKSGYAACTGVLREGISMKPTYEELELQLEESQREFRAADATIHNLELKITDMAVQLANAESKCRELAAELSAVDKIHNEAVFITDDHYEQCPPEVHKMIRSLAVLQIPAYDAYLAEMRAQESAPLVRALTVIANSEQHDGETVVCDFDTLISVAAGALRDHYASQLRKGAAL
ncbi:hypothetical protein U2G61_004114 [Citrobacter freundii]|nr:hypothetical protein [Citrobacter freundii]